jgi:branched-chain amino acid aminotransferase
VPKFSPVELVVAAWKWGAYLGEKSDTGVHVYLLPWRRIHHSQFDMKAKLGGLYILSTICGTLAREKGFDEAVFLNLEGNVAEGPGENILIVKDGVLKTNDVTESILEGITRTSILKIAEDMGIPTTIGPITKQEFLLADEIFFSGTAVEIAPIVRVTDDSESDEPAKEYSIATGQVGPITKKLVQAYKGVVLGENKRYESWLTHVYD